MFSIRVKALFEPIVLLKKQNKTKQNKTKQKQKRQAFGLFKKHFFEKNDL